MTDQEIRLKFGEMNAGEMRLARALVAWHEREIAKLKEGLAEAQQIAESWSKHIHPATHDSIVSTKDEEIAALKAELAALRQPILADDGRSLIDIYGDAFDVARVKRQLPMKECCDSGFKAVASVVLAQAVRRMEAVPKEEIWKVYKDDPHPFAQEALEAVRTRLIAAVKGEGQQPIKGLEGLTKERCLRIAEVEGDSTIAAGRPDVCPHAAPHVFCETCKVSPCPIGIPAKREGQAKPVVVNEPDLSGESEKPAQPWTPAVGDTVRLKSGGPPMTVTHVDPLSLMCAWMNAGNELQVEPITTFCLTPAQP